MNGYKFLENSVTGLQAYPIGYTGKYGQGEYSHFGKFHTDGTHLVKSSTEGTDYIALSGVDETTRISIYELSKLGVDRYPNPYKELIIQDYSEVDYLRILLFTDSNIMFRFGYDTTISMRDYSNSELTYTGSIPIESIRTATSNCELSVFYNNNWYILCSISDPDNWMNFSYKILKVNVTRSTWSLDIVADITDLIERGETERLTFKSVGDRVYMLSPQYSANSNNYTYTKIYTSTDMINWVSIDNSSLKVTDVISSKISVY